MLFNLDFAKNSILSCFFFFFLITDLHFLILALVTQIFNPIAEQLFNTIAELLIPIGILIKEAKAEIQKHKIIAESKMRKCSI